MTNYRVKDSRKLFKPSPFNIMLMSDQGEFISACFGSRFTYSLMNKECNLQPGRYIIMIDPIWNETTKNQSEYQDVLIDVYAPECVDLTQVDDNVGMMFLESALKNAAYTVAPPQSKTYHLEDDEDFSTEYGKHVFRIQDVECLDCWYGFILTSNESQYELNEIVKPQIEGL